MHRLLLALLLTLVACPQAAARDRTIKQDLNVAHRYWHTDTCRGQWNVIPDATLRQRQAGGHASGLSWTWTGVGFDWAVERCEFTIDPRLTGCRREYVIRHEIGHFVHGPGHEGPMSYEVLNRVPCEGARQRAKAHRAKVRLRGQWWLK